MLNNFIYAQTKELFLEALGAGNILDEAIVFIEDTKEIWNHGHYFGPDSERFQELEDDLSKYLPLSGGTIDGNLRIGKTSSDAGTDKTRIYFGDGDYVWIGEYNAGDDTAHDDNLAVYSPNGLFIMNDSDSYIHIGPYGIYSDYNPVLGTSSNRFSNGYFSGKLYATNGFFEESDERLKNFDGKINIDLDKLSKLKKNYFTWKNDSNTKQIGVSAQEIMELYPEIVSETEDGILNVAYEKLSVVALAAVDELYKKNQELEERLAKLESISLNKN